MATANRPLIVGAGPTGKAAALFLARAGVVTRVVDIAPQPSQQSKALAINPRTLELLEPTGVTARMLAIGIQVRAARVRSDDKVLAEVRFEQLKHRFPFMLAISQAATERLLGEALEEAGGTVERPLGLVTCRQSSDAVEADLRDEVSGELELHACPWLLAADGAHSTARTALDIDFAGSSLRSPWRLADLPLNTSLEEDMAHIFLFAQGGFLFLLRVVDESTIANSGPPLWRVISDCDDPIARLVDAAPAGPPVWQSSFHISHRIAERMQIGNVYFAGDAAHIHSPIGARGLNLGIEDAWVFSALARRGEISRYGSLQRRVDAGVVRRIELVTRMVLGESAFVRLLRSAVMRVGLKLPFVQRRLLPIVAGLDHALSVAR
jgi:2-polyprenyl-6-methoxyphenol hydroxylase-like FAD-dependent oxidoreductase